MEEGFVSARARRWGNFKMELRDIFLDIAKNPYHETDNPTGIINMSTAHNDAISEVVVEKLNQSSLKKWHASMLPYTPGRLGIPRLRSAIAEFLTQELGTPEPLDPDKFCIANGVTSLNCMMGFVLCNEGDTILTPSPLYGAIPRDFLFMPNVKTYPVPLNSKPGVSSTEPFELTVELLEDALKRAKVEGHRVKVLLLTNPYNPLGTVFTREQVLMCLQFCKRHDLHCVVDEVYVCSIYDPDTPHSSLWGFHPDQLPDKSKTHVMWGFSKDFGMSGTPVGVVYSWNPTVISSLGCIVDFVQVPHFIQMEMAKLLEDREWLQNVHFATSRRLLRESSEIVMATLDEIGVPYVKPSAGFFIWANFSKYLQEDSLNGESALKSSFLHNGIAILSGAAFYYDNEYGWFRIIFTIPRGQLIEAMKRLRQTFPSQPGSIKVERNAEKGVPGILCPLIDHVHRGVIRHQAKLESKDDQQKNTVNGVGDQV